MKTTKVWEVWAFSGENPDNIISIPSPSPFVFADDETEAILRSGIYGQVSLASYANLNFKFVTIIANEIGLIKVNS